MSIRTVNSERVRRFIIWGYGVVTSLKKRVAAVTGTDTEKTPLLNTGVSVLICQSTGGMSEPDSSRMKPPVVAVQLMPIAGLLAGVVVRPGRKRNALPPTNRVGVIAAPIA